jgi:hypothetical protein
VESHSRLILLLVLLLATLRGGVPAFASPDCEDSFKALPTSGQSAVEPFSHWSFAEPPTPTPEQILPDDFLTELKTNLGKPRVEVEAEDGRIGFKVYAGRRVNQVMEWAFFQDEQPDTLEVDELVLQNPIAGTTGKLHYAQESKGVPFKTFMYARNRLFELAKAGGYQAVSSRGAENFTVLMLYRKMVGMSPRDPLSIETVEYLDRLYRFAKTLPEDIRPKSLDEFSRSLGDYWHPAAGVRSAKYRWKKGAPGTYEAFKDDEGHVLAIAIPGEKPGSPRRVFYINQLDDEPDVLQWSTICRKAHAVRLSRDISTPAP